MDKNIVWDDLILIYINSRWIGAHDAVLTLASQQVVDLVRKCDQYEDLSRDAGISFLIDTSQIQIGQTIDIQIGPPRLGLGALVETWDALLSFPEAHIKAPANYFIKRTGEYSSSKSPTENQIQYARLLKLVSLLERSSVYLDPKSSSLIYFKEVRVEIPVLYSFDDFSLIKQSDVSDLAQQLDSGLHDEQRLALLSDIVISLAVTQPKNFRFRYIAQNLDEILKSVKEGYKLFASSFSYTKIRSDIEQAQSDYVNRIHKTFSDIQGQVLGLPIASVIVASQMKSASTCGSEMVANIAVTFGSWLFALLIFVSCINQWWTLDAISLEISRQEGRLRRDFLEIKSMFDDGFNRIRSRLCWHRFILSVLIFVSLIGAAATQVAYSIFTTVPLSACRTSFPTIFGP